MAKTPKVTYTVCFELKIDPTISLRDLKRQLKEAIIQETGSWPLRLVVEAHD